MWGFYCILNALCKGMKRLNIQELKKLGRDRLEEKQVEDSSHKADILLQFFLKMKKTWLVIHMQETVEEEKVTKYLNAIEEVIGGKPVQYITNEQSFMNLKFYVDENVLIPQPDTEVLVETALTEVDKTIKILDLCTGSGAIAVALEHFLEEKEVEIVATDISEKALEIAKKNAISNNANTKIKFIQSDLFAQIPKQKFDLIVSNPPYIETETIKTLSKEVQNEPKIALDGGEDGLAFYRRIAKEAFDYLEYGGKLLLEIGYNQKEKVMALLQKEKKYVNIRCIKDFENRDRVIMAEKLKK